MKKKTFVVSNVEGVNLHMASHIVEEANKFCSYIRLAHRDYTINCKSLMSILAFPVCPGEEVSLECEGEDEQEAFAHLIQLFDQTN